MKKAIQKTDVLDLAKSIDAELSARSAELDSRAEELQIEKDRLVNERAEFESTREKMLQEKAEFGALQAEVQAKLEKIRSDQKLSEDLQEQALTAKSIEAKLKEAKEEHGVAQLKLEEVAKRELAVSIKEKNYKEELKKEFAANLFKG
jgi:hypothetical protein